MFTPTPKFYTADTAWRYVISSIYDRGERLDTRGLNTIEILNLQAAVSMKHPVITSPARRVGYGYMAAQALWILDGSNKLTDLGRFAKHEAKFSDDGETLWGAYGPRFNAQLDFAIESLQRDRASRQAVITAWRPIKRWRSNIGEFFASDQIDSMNIADQQWPITKDMPCTICLTFNVRDERLNCHAFMRSSDAWLGIPYDWFTFTMLACRVASYLTPVPELGHLFYNAVSSHLYIENLMGVRNVLREPPDVYASPELTQEFVRDHALLRDSLKSKRDATQIERRDDKPLWRFWPQDAADTRGAAEKPAAGV